MSVARLQSRPIARLQHHWNGRPAAVDLALTALTVVALALLAGAAPARADIGETIIQRCTHGESLAGFSQSAYRKALSELEADTEEYSSCSQQIREAQLAAIGRPGGGAGGTGLGGTSLVATPTTPAEQGAIARAQRVRPQALRLGGGVVDPGVVHADIASAFSTLPTPLLTILAFLLACLLLFCGGALRNRLRGRAR